MAQNVVETIFNSKKNLSDFYPQFPGVKTFDLEKKHLLYGRIDKQGDAIYLDESNLDQVDSLTGAHQLAVDFVASAFSDLQRNIKSAAEKGYISRESAYPSKLRVAKSWTTGDLEFSYNHYLNKLYTTFVDSYLSIDHRSSRIKNFKDFTKEFLRFFLRTAKYFPFTRTGYILSNHCSPFISGLMLEIAPENHGVENNVNILKYVNDVNFTFFVNEVKKFGFMVDKNAPWRIVYNVASGLEDKRGSGSLTGAQKYMDNFAVNYDNLFKTYYRKSYLDDLINVRNKLYSFYEQFYLQFSTYETPTYIKCTENQDSYDLRVKSVRRDREPTPAIQDTAEENEYWLKVLLKMRLAETGQKTTPHDFTAIATETIRLSRIFSLSAGIKRVNELTRGLPVTTFVNKGDYWHGISDAEYQKRAPRSLENAINPLNVDYSLTSTKNIK